jgi:uncharacterized surface protein with fasciclin (FAS1) repeats
MNGLNTVSKRKSSPLVLALVMMAAAFTSGQTLAGAHSGSPAPKDIVDTAVSAGSFNTLAAALKAADLVGALKGEGPFTVFAPTDEAFAKLPAGTLENLLKPESKDTLKAILLYHVVAGKIMANDIGSSATPSTLEGTTISVKADAKGVTVNGANVIKADVIASNGVIHVIDQVILPAPAK